MNKQKSYNERLFNSNIIRSYFHFSRFYWVRSIIRKYKLPYSRIIELGCFDGKLINYLPEKPKFYQGYDANWENGLDIAKNNWKDNEKIKFDFASDPKDISENDYDLGISMETFEHISPELVCPYLKKLSEVINGYILITVPNEKGLFFLIKSLLKPACNLSKTKYSKLDILNLFLGRTNYVERDNHKGFDYDHLLYDVKKFFDIVEVSPYPKVTFLPLFLGFGTGILARTKN